MKAEEFIKQLPIFDYLEEVNQKLVKQQRLILQAEPGAGKSTAVPWYLLNNADLQGKKIVMLEPRRLAASSLASFLASLLDEKVGETIGYQVKNERRISAKTRLEIVTEGVLTARIQKDPELSDVAILIFDEFHERSLHADLGIALTQDIMQAYNEDLKVLVMSATLDSDKLSSYLHQAPVINCPGRCYPVSVEYSQQAISSSRFTDWRLPMLNLIKKAIVNTEKGCDIDGDVLVFLPGQAEIKLLLDDLKNWLEDSGQANKKVILPLFGQLKGQQQKQALQLDAEGRQKVILATNIAETSLTIPNIAAVVDSGLARSSEYDVTSGMNRLLTRRIAKDSAEQRMGRAGRVQAGKCYRLWTESQQQSLAEHLPLPILTMDLTALRLSLAQWGTKDVTEVDWLTEPPKAHFSAATELLQNLTILDEHQTLTEIGLKAAKTNLEPRLARCLLQAETLPDEHKLIAADLVAILSDSQFYRGNKDADLSQRFYALQAYRKDAKQALKTYPIKAVVIQQVVLSAQNYRKQLAITQNQNLCLDYSNSPFKHVVAQLLSYAFPDRIAKRRAKQVDEQLIRYQMSNGKGSVLFVNDVLQAGEWMVVADLDGQRKDGVIYLACAIEEAELQHYPGFSSQAQYQFNETKQKLEGHLVTKLGDIVVKQNNLVKPDKNAMQDCLFKALRDSNLALLNWPKKSHQWLQRVNWLAQQNPNKTVAWPEFSQKALVEDMANWLLPYLEQVYDFAALKKVDVFALLQSRLDYADLQEIDVQAPEVYVSPIGKPVPIEYKLGQNPKVSLPLQQVFGELSSPTLAWGRVNLSFELLSPAQRPLQTTNDLAGFWKSSYFEIAKEMRGRYPKHRWPEEPLKEKPGSSIKRK